MCSPVPIASPVFAAWPAPAKAPPWSSSTACSTTKVLPPSSARPPPRLPRHCARTWWPSARTQPSPWPRCSRTRRPSASFRAGASSCSMKPALWASMTWPSSLTWLCASAAGWVMSGDTGQHASVARGDALRILEQYSSYRFSELTTIRRQKPEAFRQAVELAAAKQTDKAFAKLLELGAVTEALTDDGKLYQRAADAYLSATKQGKSALLVSPTWSEIEAVTEKVREALKACGAV